MMLMSNTVRETQFLFRQKYLIGILTVALVLSVFSVWSGISEITTQKQTIERLKQKDEQDRNSVLAKQSDYGAAAYYTFHLTYSDPSELAFAAIGQRDVFPWKHRVRMLALEGQIYETDADNPELSFLGRFDFAFLVSILLPLFVILLLHDLRSSERESGRYDLLLITAVSQKSLWLTRAAVLSTALALVVLLPFVIGAIVSNTPFIDALLTVSVVLLHIALWSALVFWYTGRTSAAKLSSTKIASVMLSLWLVTTVLVPASSHVVIDHLVDSPKGGDILLTQREAVNDAWDLPDDATWSAFLETHPQWQDYIDMGPTFEWKWYYAFQQVGDQKVSELSKQYRLATLEKDRLAGYLSVLSPPMLTQRVMSALAKTDTQAAMQYEDKIRAYHQSLREFYYPLMFKRAQFSIETMSELPKFSGLKEQQSLSEKQQGS